MPRLCSQMHQPERSAVITDTETLGVWVLATQRCCCLIAKPYLTLVTPQTAAHQAPLFMGFSRQEYWSQLPSPSPGALPNPGIEPMSRALTGKFFTTGPPGKPSSTPKPHVEDTEPSHTQRKFGLTGTLTLSLEAPKAHREAWQQNCLSPGSTVTLETYLQSLSFIKIKNSSEYLPDARNPLGIVAAAVTKTSQVGLSNMSPRKACERPRGT